MEFLDKIRKRRKNQITEDILLREKPERRLLSSVPDPANVRSNSDRRGIHDDSNQKDYEDIVKEKTAGIRYECRYDVAVKAKGKKYLLKAVDVSETGILLETDDKDTFLNLSDNQTVKMKFEVTPGSMPEGNEIKVNIKASISRTQEKEDIYLLGYRFEKDLREYRFKAKDRYALTASSIALFVISLCILLMRSESVIYLKFNKWLYLYSIITAVFLLSRYLFGALYRPVKVNPDFTPGVTIVIPCFNEEEWIQRTILSCINQDYPADKLEVIVVDDCSSDKSVEKIKEIIEKLCESESDRFLVKTRLSYYVQPQNAGKREALVRGVDVAKHEFVVFVDSDSFLDPYAIRHLVQPFKDPKMGGVAGRTDVANTYTNSLTKMQSVRYYIAFRIMKAAEGYFDTVTCLSGPLSCYRKETVLKYRDRWLNQKFLGQKATFGDDRSMTNFVLEHERTGYQDTAVCSTIVPNNYKTFLKQQMRWKRSWLRESLTAGKFMWRKEPFAAFFFYIGLAVPILAPVVVIYNLIYVPVSQHIFPTTFLVGMLLMSLMMSAAQLFLRKSTTWAYGLFFCLYYEAVLLWQMPIAILTFWKSTWGTRMTQKDVEFENNKKKTFKEWFRELFRKKKNDTETANMESSTTVTADDSINKNVLGVFRKEVIMAQLSLKSALFGYSKKDVSRFIDELSAENAKKEADLRKKIDDLEAERRRLIADKAQLSHDQTAAMQVLIDAQNHADSLKQQAEDEYKTLAAKREAEFEEQKRNLDNECNEKMKQFEEEYERKVSEYEKEFNARKEKQEDEFNNRHAKISSSTNKVQILLNQIQNSIATLGTSISEIKEIDKETVDLVKEEVQKVAEAAIMDEEIVCNTSDAAPEMNNEAFLEESISEEGQIAGAESESLSENTDETLENDDESEKTELTDEVSVSEE